MKQLIKLVTFFSIVLFSMNNSLYAQSENPYAEKTWYQKGSVYGTIFANFHTSGSEVGKQNAFAVERAYLGYKTQIDEHFAANIKLDIGASELLGRRFAYFKNAYLEYKFENLKIQAGIADAFQMKTQEQFWGYRYIYKSFQDQYKFGSSADIGIFISYKFSNWFSADYSINNGDGYGSIQNATTDNLKNTLGLTVKPFDILTLRMYGDVMSLGSDSTQSTLVGFAGLSLEKFSIGGEYVYQFNNNLRTDYNYGGISTFATYKINKKFKIFARYDFISSDEISLIVDIDGNPILDANGNQTYEAWNLGNDGNLIMGGVEYSPIKKVNIALNYRLGLPADSEKDNTNWIFLNLQASF